MCTFSVTIHSLEEGEVDAAVGTVLHEMGMGREVLCLAVLKDKKTTRVEG